MWLPGNLKLDLVGGHRDIRIGHDAQGLDLTRLVEDGPLEIIFATLLGVCHDLLVEPQFAIEHEVNGEGIRGRGIGMFENIYSVWMTTESDTAFSSDWRKLLIIARMRVDFGS